tara:strand:- start:4272 stop:5069 length:798 start_codon:yes stop_codon:yes gene_type:complete
VKTIYLTLTFIFGIYFLIILVIYTLQRSLLYHPSENNYLEEKLLDHKIKKITISSENKLVGWYFKKDPKLKTLIFFHGNAGKLENRIYKLNDLSKLNINYLIFAYRGFSGNKGNPSEDGIYFDARAAKKWLNSNGVEDHDLILYGESLGTAISIDLAKDFDFAGIILESPFTSMVDLAKIYYPYLPVNIMLKDRYDSINKIKYINSPILIMHGMKDKIVPYDMGIKIFEIANNPKYKYFNDYDDHMMEFNKNLINSIDNFIKSLN